MSDKPELETKHLFTQLNYLLDLEYLRGLEANAPLGAKEKFMTGLGTLFLKSAPLCIQDLDRALLKGDMKAILHQSIRLKSLSMDIGAKYMIDLCQQIEKGTHDKDLSLAQTLGEQLQDAFLVTSDQVQAYIAQFIKKP